MKKTFKSLVSMTIIIFCSNCYASDAYKSDPNRLSSDAYEYVRRESPDSYFPFALAKTGQGGSLVVAHYFPFFPLSYDGLPPDKDYYTTEFLRASGEGGKHARQGGFLRERPLPSPFWSIPKFRDGNFAVEIERATRIGIDGFGVNLLSLKDQTFMPSARKLLDAAQASGKGFRIFPEPDMSVLSGLTPVDLADALMPFATHSSALRINGALLVMPIAAESYPLSFWQQLVVEMRRRGQSIVLMPCYYDPAPSAIEKLRSISWGATFWGTRGPTAGDIAGNVVTHLEKNGIAQWMFPVSPQDARPKDLRAFEAGNFLSYSNQWEKAIALNAKRVQIVTWNDYSETSEVAPSSFSNFVFYDLTAYYISWLKNGIAPILTRDALYFIQRRQIFRPDLALQGARWSRAGDSPWSNDIEVVALLKKPGQLVLRSGNAIVRKAVGSGLQTIRIPANPGAAVVTLQREGREVAKYISPIIIDAHPNRHDPTYGGGSSLRKPLDDQKEKMPPNME